jgi:Ca2+-binding EF-hand superfamily protein
LQAARLKLKKTAQINEIDDRLRQLKELVTNEEKMHAKDLHKIFLFSSPKLYLTVVTHLLMLISLYLGVWITHFVSHAHLIGLSEGAGEFVTVLPGLIASFLYGSITKSAVLLKCITKLDTDVLEEVLESAEESKDLGLQVKDKMMKKLSDMGDPETALRLLFEEIDVDGSEVLSREEFHDFCVMLKLSFSKKKWRHIFREIDRNQNDEISYEELFLFLFPNNNAAIRQETRRANARKKEVLAKAASLQMSRRIASTTLSPRSEDSDAGNTSNAQPASTSKATDVTIEEIDELDV